MRSTHISEDTSVIIRGFVHAAFSVIVIWQTASNVRMPDTIPTGTFWILKLTLRKDRSFSMKRAFHSLLFAAMSYPLIASGAPMFQSGGSGTGSSQSGSSGQSGTSGQSGSSSQSDQSGSSGQSGTSGQSGS